MKLRPLQKADAPLMLEWMHDASVTEFMATDFSKKTLDDCLRFIDFANESAQDVHLAIEDDEGAYMGTVSLKNVDCERSMAEFAITVRTAAMGKGISSFGMREIIRYAFEQLRLRAVYWYVNAANARAVRFYDKNGYQRISPEKLAHLGEIINHREYLWYEVEREA